VTEAAGTARSADAAPLEPEDEARAGFYALLARLFAAPPDAALLQAIAAAQPLTVTTSDETAHSLARAWDGLAAASRGVDPEAVTEEYEALFIGVGKSEVSLHAAAYLPSGGGNVLAEMRGKLAALGLGRLPGVSMFEDHLAVAFETMRVLVGGGPKLTPASVGEQSDFFLAYVGSWAPQCCTAITQIPIANYYLRVAEFTQIFVALEAESFAIE
jgi:TorA maturation chaperone TorD